jgi:hypothetical protein
MVSRDLADLCKCVDTLAWILQLPPLPGEMDVRREVVELMTSNFTKESLLHTGCSPETYKKLNISHQDIAERLYLPVIDAVANGTLVLNTELRTKLLKIYVPSKDSHVPALTYKGNTCRRPEYRMQAAFSAVLSTLSFETQEQVLHDRLGALMDADPWEPWFTDWMEKYLARGLKVRSFPRYGIMSSCNSYTKPSLSSLCIFRPAWDVLFMQ